MDEYHNIFHQCQMNTLDDLSTTLAEDFHQQSFSSESHSSQPTTITTTTLSANSSVETCHFDDQKSAKQRKTCTSTSGATWTNSAGVTEHVVVLPKSSQILSFDNSNSQQNYECTFNPKDEAVANIEMNFENQDYIAPKSTQAGTKRT